MLFSEAPCNQNPSLLEGKATWSFDHVILKCVQENKNVSDRVLSCPYRLSHHFYPHSYLNILIIIL